MGIAASIENFQSGSGSGSRSGSGSGSRSGSGSGSVSAVVGAAPIACAPGKYSIAGSAECSLCPAGTYGLGASTSSACSGNCAAPPGKYCPAGSTTSTPINCDAPPGQYCPGGASGISPCPANYSCPGGTGVPTITSCPPGYTDQGATCFKAGHDGNTCDDNDYPGGYTMGWKWCVRCYSPRIYIGVYTCTTKGPSYFPYAVEDVTLIKGVALY